jgi:hypothetical protein
MAQPAKPLEHADAEKKSDESLRSEARAHLGATPPLQLVAELLTKLRTLDLPWWKPEMLRERWPAVERMRWYRARPDLRQKITSALTGLQPKAARKKAAEFQGGLIDSVIDEGDVSARAFEESFDPADLVVYGPVEAFWSGFVEKMPWKQDTSVHQELIAWLLDALLADHSAIDGMRRKPILTAWEARTAIDGRVWHTRMPLEIRVAIDDARFRKEREQPGSPFHAASDLSIAVAQTIATSIPLRDLAPVFTAAERIMGFAAHKPSGGPEAGPKSIGSTTTPTSATTPTTASASSGTGSSATATPTATATATGSSATATATPTATATGSSATATPTATGSSATVTGSAATPSVAPAARPSVAPPAVSSASPSIPPPAAVPVDAVPPARPSVAPPAAPVPPSPPAQPQAPRALSTPPPPLAAVKKSEAAPGGAESGALLASRSSLPSSSLISKPGERPTSSGIIEVPAAIRAEFSAAAASPPVKPEGVPKPASSTSPRAAAATLIDALAHIPAEDERTNPWDIPSEDGSGDGDDTGVTAPIRREDVGSGGKRKRSGKG